MSRKGYSFWSRFMHHLALGNNAVAEATFDIERMFLRPRGSDVTSQPHVFVTGLARAGTTILMRLIYGTGGFRSLSYRDMPFVLAPKFWGQVVENSRISIAAEERAHGDGIFVDFDSPEALEEIFWRVTCGTDYIRRDRLVPMSTGPEAEQAFREYVALLLRRHPGKRYLSKNNNNILRLPSLSRCFPNAAVIIPFRDPLEHACSLLQQHRNFLHRHGADRFSKKYMTWLVHHEFGADHRPFAFDEKAADRGARQGRPDADLDYWLQLWIEVYEFVFSAAPERCILLSYDRLCDSPQEVWSALCSRLRLPHTPVAEELHRIRRVIAQPASDDLLRRAGALHDAHCERAIQGVCRPAHARV